MATPWSMWHALSEAQRRRVVEDARPRMLELAKGMGARTEAEIRGALALVAAACQAELDGR